MVQFDRETSFYHFMVLCLYGSIFPVHISRQTNSRLHNGAVSRRDMLFRQISDSVHSVETSSCLLPSLLATKKQARLSHHQHKSHLTAQQPTIHHSQHCFK